ncbi:hypothetical protein GCM10027431_09730 [Lysobacter rhizosphaerae]
MGKLEKRAISLSLFAACFGIACSIWFRNWEHFARSGSLVTVVAIAFASLDLRERIRKANSFVDEQLQIARGGLIKKGRHQGLDQIDVDLAVKRFESEMREEVRDAASKASKRILLVEVTLFVVGTLIWGYGDIAAKFVLPDFRV